jgi:RimJ/RimL family protein N-acetyltransferase
MKYINFSSLTVTEAGLISQLLLDSPPDYVKYFHPFDFNLHSLKLILEKTIKDRFFGVELKSETSHNNELIGFYMLRGLDEGYTEPMYGVFIHRKYSGKGIASLTIAHAESFCKLQGYKQLLLKVFPENIRAKNLYERLGFEFLRKDESSQQLVLGKELN